MRFLHKLFQYAIIAIFVGGGILVASFGFPFWWKRDVPITLDLSYLRVFCSGVALVCFGLLYAITGAKRKPKDKPISFENEGGKVTMMSSAISDFLAKLSTEFPSVARMKATPTKAKGVINVLADVKVKSGPQIHEVCELLQQRIRESMTSGLGIKDVGSIEVKVGGIVSEHKPV